jgi:hypothetical protein
MNPKLLWGENSLTVTVDHAALGGVGQAMLGGLIFLSGRPTITDNCSSSMEFTDCFEARLDLPGSVGSKQSVSFISRLSCPNESAEFEFFNGLLVLQYLS